MEDIGTLVVLHDLMDFDDEKQENLIAGPIFFFFCIWILFFLTRHFCFFSLFLFVTFSSFDFLWHTTDYWHSNVNKNVRNTPPHMLCTQRNDDKPNVEWNCTQMHPTWKSGWMNQKMLDEKFNREQTSSNLVQHNGCLLFSFSINFVSSQMHPTFRLTSKIYDVGWNVGYICVGLLSTSIFFVCVVISVLIQTQRFRYLNLVVTFH